MATNPHLASVVDYYIFEEQSWSTSVNQHAYGTSGDDVLTLSLDDIKAMPMAFYFDALGGDDILRILLPTSSLDGKISSTAHEQSLEIYYGDARW